MFAHLSTTRIDLLLWPDASPEPRWFAGDVVRLDRSWQIANDQLERWAGTSACEYGLLWSASRPLPSGDVLDALTASDVDVAHTGLLQGLDKVMPELDMVFSDWSMINAPASCPSSSWRVGLD